MTWFQIVQLVIAYFAIGFLIDWILLRIPGFVDMNDDEDAGTLVATVFFWPFVIAILIIAGVLKGIERLIKNELTPSRKDNKDE